MAPEFCTNERMMSGLTRPPARLQNSAVISPVLNGPKPRSMRNWEFTWPMSSPYQPAMFVPLPSRST